MAHTITRLVIFFSFFAIFITPQLFSQNASNNPVPGEWIKGSLESVGLAATRMAQMDSAIQRGDFKSVTSVLIARHAKLVHESYFDNEPNSVRNTRSLTKTITGMLIGIAI